MYFTGVFPFLNNLGFELPFPLEEELEDDEDELLELEEPELLDERQEPLVVEPES